MTDEKDAAPLVAISICEALMVSLVEKGLLDWEEIQDTLEAAMDSHLQAGANGFTREDHAEAARMIQSILRRSNAVRRIPHR